MRDSAERSGSRRWDARLLAGAPIAIALVATTALRAAAAPDPPVAVPKVETSPAGPPEPVIVDSPETD